MVEILLFYKVKTVIVIFCLSVRTKTFLNVYYHLKFENIIQNLSVRHLCCRDFIYYGIKHNNIILSNFIIITILFYIYTVHSTYILNYRV